MIHVLSNINVIKIRVFDPLLWIATVAIYVYASRSKDLILTRLDKYGAGKRLKHSTKQRLKIF